MSTALSLRVLAGAFSPFLAFIADLRGCNSGLPLMSAILPGARATLMVVNISLLSLAHAAGAWLASRFFDLGTSQTILFNALAVVGFNLLALLALSCLRKVENHYGNKPNLFRTVFLIVCTDLKALLASSLLALFPGYRY